MSVKGFVSKASLVVVSTLFALLVAEILLRIFWPPIQPMGFGGMMVRDEEFGHRLVTNSSKVISSGRGEFSTTIETNSHGFRFPEYDMKPEPGVLRIALFGDSEVFGVGVDEEDMLNIKMEEILNGSGDTQYQVLNFAMPAIGTTAEARILERIALAWEPDAAVFVVTVANDLIDNVNFARRGRAPEEPPKKPNAVLSWFKRLRLYAFAGFKIYPNLPAFLTPPAAWFNVGFPTVDDVHVVTDRH